jgi:predicted GNAT family acetyltransferase
MNPLKAIPSSQRRRWTQEDCGMNTRVFAAAGGFLGVARGYLEADEVRYNLILGLAGRLVSEPHAWGSEDPWFCAVEADGQVCAAAMRTPPHKILVAHFSGDPAAIAEGLVSAVAERWPGIPGVVGDPELADCFAARWCTWRGVSIKARMAERIYRLERVEEIALSTGRLRLAQARDAELVDQWGRAYHEEVHGAASAEEPAMDFRGKVGSKDVYVWEDPAPVSMAARARPTENGIRINGVYTPREQRCRGYATSCVAMLCRELLGAGYRFCTLYTDLANPTSNSIYQKIGFRAVCDSADNWFAA